MSYLIIAGNAPQNSPHFTVGVGFFTIEMNLVVRESHFDSLYFVLKLLEVAGLLHECIVMQSFVDEPHEDIYGLFVSIVKIFYAQDDLEG